MNTLLPLPSNDGVEEYDSNCKMEMMMKPATCIIAATTLLVSATFGADLYFDMNGTEPGFGVNGDADPFEVNYTNLTWNTDSTGGDSGSITTVNEGDVLHFGLEGTSGILFNWTYFTNAAIGGIHTYLTDGSTANINRFQKNGGGLETIRWAPGATFNTEKACSLWWDLGLFGDFEKAGSQWLILTDNAPRINGTCTITQGNIIYRSLQAVGPSISSFDLNGGELRFAGGLSGTASIDTLSGSGKVDRDGAGSIVNVAINIKGFDMINGSATDLIAFDRGPDVELADDAVTSMEINKLGGTNYSDTVKTFWEESEITLNGSLNITLLGGSETLAAGDSFQLFEKHANANFLGTGFSSYTFPALGAGLTWDITALFTDGTLSVVSGSTDPVGIPSGLTASGKVYTVTLDWDDNTEANLGGYKVYRSEISGSGYTVVAVTTESSYTDTTTLPNDITYYYTVSAFNLRGDESDQGIEDPAYLAFNLGNGDFETPEGNARIDASGHWMQDGDQQAIQAAGWAAETGAQGAWLKGFNTTVTNSFYQDKDAIPGLDYTFDAGFKIGAGFRANGGQIEMALIWLDGSGAEFSSDSLDIIAAISTDGSFVHTNITATAPVGAARVRAQFYWTTTVDAGTDGTGDKSSLIDNATLIQSGNLYDAWALSYGLTGDDAASTNDYEGDGMDNLLEYALGGNPKVDDASDKLPVFTVADDAGSDWFYYVHTERIDDNTLTYTVVKKDDLANDSSWSTDGIEPAGVSTPSGDFRSVTNRTDVGLAEFLRLEVTQD